MGGLSSGASPSNRPHIKKLSPATDDVLQLRLAWSYCSQRQQPSENGIGMVARAPAHPDRFLKPQEYITAAMTDKVTIVSGKLEGNDVRIMLDSGSSVSLIDKGSVPN